MSTLRIIPEITVEVMREGIGSGAIYGALFYFFAFFPQSRAFVAFDVAAAALGALVGASIGGGLAAGMGGFIGLIMAFEARQHPWPLGKRELRRVQWAGELACTLATVGAYTVLVIPMVWPEGFLTVFLLILPLTIAYWRSRVAVARYIQQLENESTKRKLLA